MALGALSKDSARIELRARLSQWDSRNRSNTTDTLSLSRSRSLFVCSSYVYVIRIRDKQTYIRGRIICMLRMTPADMTRLCFYVPSGMKCRYKLKARKSILDECR